MFPLLLLESLFPGQLDGLLGNGEKKQQQQTLTALLGWLDMGVDSCMGLAPWHIPHQASTLELPLLQRMGQEPDKAGDYGQPGAGCSEDDGWRDFLSTGLAAGLNWNSGRVQVHSHGL